MATIFAVISLVDGLVMLSKIRMISRSRYGSKWSFAALSSDVTIPVWPPERSQDRRISALIALAPTFFAGPIRSRSAQSPCGTRIVLAGCTRRRGPESGAAAELWLEAAPLHKWEACMLSWIQF